MTGRKPVPTRLKVLRGNPGKRALNAREPEVARAQPDPPDCLSAGARQKWDELCPQLYAARILTKLDGDMLGAYCEAFVEWAAATKHITEHGLTIQKPAGEKISPHVTLRNRALPQLRAFGAELGMSPSSRSRLVAAEAPKAKSKWDGVLT